MWRLRLARVTPANCRTVPLNCCGRAAFENFYLKYSQLRQALSLNIYVVECVPSFLHKPYGCIIHLRRCFSVLCLCWRCHHPHVCWESSNSPLVFFHAVLFRLLSARNGAVALMRATMKEQKVSIHWEDEHCSRDRFSLCLRTDRTNI